MSPDPIAATLIRGGHLFDLERPFEVGDLLVQDGAIAAIGGTIAPPAGARVIDAAGRIVMPGLINAHTHSNQSIERGLCDALPLDLWMIVASYGGAGAVLSPRDQYVSTMVGALEMLATGTTAVLDCPRVDVRTFNEGMDQVMGAYADVGMRASVAAQYSDLDFFESLPMELAGGAPRPPVAQPKAAELFARIEPFLERWKARDSRLVPLLGPSSLPRCSVDLFTASLEVARKHGVGLHTHLLSAKSQVPVARARYGGSTVEFLRRSGGLERWVSFAHAIWLDQSEIEMLGRSEAMIVHNPMSNLKLGAGVAAVPAMLRAGVPVALGTDGGSSNDSQNMFETLKGAALIQRAVVPHAEWPTAMQTLRMCWEGGARAMGQKVGRLERGYLADLALLGLGTLRLGPKAQMAQQLVYGELGSSVETVLVDGRVVVSDGKVLGVDAAAIHRDAQALVDRIWATLPDRDARFEEVRPSLERLESAVRGLALPFSRFA